MLLPIFRIPHTNKVNFKNFLEVTSNSQPPLSFMHNARVTMVAQLKSESPSNAVPAVEDYFGHINSLFQWARDRASEGKRTPAREIEFSWQSTGSKTALKFSSGLVISELVHTLSTLAATKFNAASILSNEFTDENREDLVVQAIRMFQEVAGIHEYISREVLSVLPGEVPKGSAPEYYTMFHSGAASLALASAEILLVRRGLWSGTAPELLSKIAASAAANGKQAHCTLKTAADQKPSKINPDLVAYSHAIELTGEGLCYAALAADRVAAEAWGEAAGYATKALTLLPIEASGICTAPRDPRAVKVSGILGRMTAAANKNGALSGLIEELRTPIHKNSHVYYKAVPKMDSLTPTAARAIAKPTTFDAPPLEFTTLSLVADMPKKGLLGRHKESGQGKVSVPEMDMKGGNPFGDVDEEDEAEEAEPKGKSKSKGKGKGKK